MTANPPQSDATPELTIEARQLTRTFRTGGGPFEALKNVDFAVRRGEFVAITGPSGSGKSTLLHLLAGLDQPSGGELRFKGVRVDQDSARQWALRRRNQIGIVFQFFNLIDNLSVADNIEIPALLAGQRPRDARDRRIALLDALNLRDVADLAPARLSGGQQQRVALARALVNQPELLLADEPTGNLDSQAGREVMRVIREQRTPAQTIVIVTHDARVASQADRVITMRDGRITGETETGSVDEPRRALTPIFDRERGGDR